MSSTEGRELGAREQYYKQILRGDVDIVALVGGDERRIRRHPVPRGMGLPAVTWASMAAPRTNALGNTFVMAPFRDLIRVYGRDDEHFSEVLDINQAIYNALHRFFTPINMADGSVISCKCVQDYSRFETDPNTGESVRVLGGFYETVISPIPDGG